MSIKVRELTKVYGQQKAVDNISFEVKEGEILGFLGPNGAGKSTTMKIATCYLPPTSGRVEVSGHLVTEDPIAVRNSIGYLPEHNPLYVDMYVHEYLRFIGSLHRMKGKVLKDRVSEMVAMCGLVNEQNKKLEALSKGYRQRVGLAQALIHDPKVLILDEPTTGLDPNQLVEIRGLIKNISADKTVIFSTHIMQEVQALCDRVVVINEGKIVADDRLEKLTSQNQTVTQLVVEFSDVVPMESLQRIKGVKAVEGNGSNRYAIRYSEKMDIRPAIFNFAVEHELVLLEIKKEEVGIESVFMELTKKTKDKK